MARKRMMAILAGVSMTLGVATMPAVALEAGPVAVSSEGVSVSDATAPLAPATGDIADELPTEQATGPVTELEPVADPDEDPASGATAPVEDVIAPGSGSSEPEDPPVTTPERTTTPKASQDDVRAASGSNPRVATTNAPTSGGTRTSTGQVAPRFRQQFATGGGTATQAASTQEDPGELAPMVAPARPAEQPQDAPVELAAGLQTPRTPLSGPDGAGLRTLATMLTATAAAAWYLAREHGIA